MVWWSRWPWLELRFCRRPPARTDSSSLETTAKALPQARTSRCGCMAEQDQFLQVLDRDEAERRFRAALDLRPRAVERIRLEDALERTLAEHVVSPVDVPSFDRANVDGFAVVAQDTYGASEEVPRNIALAPEHIHTGIVPNTHVRSGTAVAIATGGMVPRGADAVV